MHCSSRGHVPSLRMRKQRRPPSCGRKQGEDLADVLGPPDMPSARALASRMGSLFRSSEENAAAMKAKYRTPVWRVNSEARECAACHAVLDSLALPRAMRERSDPGWRHHCR
eukprot:2430345-Prymnesium_polylepis.1